MWVELLDGDEQGRREYEVLLRQVPGAPVAPTLHRAVLDGLELEYRIGQEHAEAEIGGGQVGEKFVLVVLARRRRWRRRKQIVGELVRKGGNQAVGPGEERRHIADLDRIGSDGKRAQRMFAMNRRGY